MLIRTALIAYCFAIPTFTHAEEKVAKKPVGTWTRANGGLEYSFAFQAEKLTIKIKTADGSITAQAAYGVTGDGTIFGILTKVEKQGIENGPQQGDLFSFDFSVVKNELTLSNLKGTRTSDEAAKTVEGVYTLEKKK